MKWGILATGTIAKKFASTVEQMGAEGEQLVAVGSRHMESAQAFAQQYGIPRCYDSYEALAADPEVEAIYIATPNTLHYENCKLCLEQGKHVLCEKPFTISPEQARELREPPAAPAFPPASAARSQRRRQARPQTGSRLRSGCTARRQSPAGSVKTQ